MLKLLRHAKATQPKPSQSTGLRVPSQRSGINQPSSPGASENHSHPVGSASCRREQNVPRETKKNCSAKIERHLLMGCRRSNTPPGIGMVGRNRPPTVGLVLDKLAGILVSVT